MPASGLTIKLKTVVQAQRTLNATELETLKTKIKDIRIAMLTTQESDGDFHTRPMATQEIDPDGTMWFFPAKTLIK